MALSVAARIHNLVCANTKNESFLLRSFRPPLPLLSLAPRLRCVPPHSPASWDRRDRVPLVHARRDTGEDGNEDEAAQYAASNDTTARRPNRRLLGEKHGQLRGADAAILAGRGVLRVGEGLGPGAEATGWRGRVGCMNGKRFWDGGGCVEGVEDFNVRWSKGI